MTNGPKKQQNWGFEKKLKRLEEISAMVEKDEIDLEVLIASYKEAKALYTELNQILNQAEQEFNTCDKEQELN